MRHAAFVACVAGVWLAASTAADADRTHHEHIAPHGGTLLVFGDEFAHLELVLDRETGALRAYVLDGEAERGVQIAQSSFVIDVAPRDRELFPVTLVAVENVLTGEVIGRSSEFAAQSDALVGLSRFDGRIAKLVIKGQRFHDIRFGFPEGNEARRPAASAPGDAHVHGPGGEGHDGQH